MRTLTKGPKPKVLVDNEVSWTTKYLAVLGTDEERKAEHWRHPQIRAALRDETSAKCAYCEAFVEDVSFPHVEHIVPRSVKPALAHDWRNLTSACGRCNTYKGAFYRERDGLIDPYVDAIDEHLTFVGALVHWTLGGARGELTARQLRLNRLDMVKARAKRLEDVRAVLDRWHAASDPLKTALAESLQVDAQEGEFTQTVVSYLRLMGFPVAPNSAVQPALNRSY